MTRFKSRLKRNVLTLWEWVFVACVSIFCCVLLSLFAFSFSAFTHHFNFLTFHSEDLILSSSNRCFEPDEHDENHIFYKTIPYSVPRSQACAQSVQNSEDESFRKAFLPDIRLFMHKDDINMSEWNRLSHFNNPFGFMGFKYDGRCCLSV